MAPTVRLAVTALAALLIWAVLDFLQVAFGVRSSLFKFGFFPAVYAAFLWASWPFFPGMALGSRVFLRAWTALGAFVTWLLPTAVFVFYFHHWIGGSK
jgi:hypothetical protein